MGVNQHPNNWYRQAASKTVASTGVATANTAPMANGVQRDAQGRIVRVNPEAFTVAQLDHISCVMRAKGYDSRGAEDAKRALSSFNARHDQNFKFWEVYPDWADAIQMVLSGKTRTSPMVPANALRKIVREFGYTNDPSTCGYILQNGDMLNMGRLGTRDFDHRQIPGYSGSEGMQKFIEAGNIRCHFAGTGFCDIRRQPTENQYRTLTQILKNYDAPFYLDIKSPWNTIHREYQSANEIHGQYDIPQIIWDIRAFYSKKSSARTGIVTTAASDQSQPHWMQDWITSVCLDAEVGDGTYIREEWVLKTEGWGDECFEGEEMSADEAMASAEEQSSAVINQWKTGYELPPGQWLFVQSGFTHGGASRHGVTWALFKKAITHSASTPSAGRQIIQQAFAELTAEFSRHPIYKGNLDGACLEASVLFRNLIRQKGMAADLVRYETSFGGHWAVRTPVGVYDPTIGWWSKRPKGVAKMVLHQVGPSSPHTKWKEDLQVDTKAAEEVFENDFKSGLPPKSAAVFAASAKPEWVMAIENAADITTAKSIADQQDFWCEIVTFANKEVLAISTQNENYVWDDGFLFQAETWIWRIMDHQLSSYIQPIDFNQYFWDHTPPVYHSTTHENALGIQEQGLEMRANTRGINNRHVPPAVFASMSKETLPSGEVTLVIDTRAMKADGFTPNVEQEPVVYYNDLRRAVAHKIGLEEFHTDETPGEDDPETVIIHADIPPKYISILNPRGAR